MSKCWYKDVCNNKDINCETRCVRYFEMSALMDKSSIPERQQTPVILYPEKCDESAFRELAKIKSDIENFVNNGENLCIYSKETGNGKTTWAIKLMLKYFDTVWPGNGFKRRGVFIHVPTFLNRLKQFENKDEKFEELKQSLFNVDLVIWDDIASTGLSAYDHSQLLTYIDQRVLNYKSNIYTTNLKDTELEKTLGSRLKSRVWNSSTTITLKGGDNR